MAGEVEVKLLCRMAGHDPVKYAARVKGRHVAGTLCKRCRVVLTVHPGSRQERRRVIRERVAA